MCNNVTVGRDKKNTSDSCTWYRVRVIRIPQQLTDLLFGAFAKLRKATISFVMSVRLSVRLNGTTRCPL